MKRSIGIKRSSARKPTIPVPSIALEAEEGNRTLDSSLKISKTKLSRIAEVRE